MRHGAGLASRRHAAHGDRQEFESLSDSPLLRSALELLSDGVAITKPNAVGDGSHFVFVNPPFGKLVGCESADLLGKSLPAGPLPPIDEAVRRWLVQTHREPARASVEVISGWIAGMPQVLRLRSDPIRDASGRVKGRLVAVRNISSEQRTEAVVWSNQRLVSIGLLATGIAHEINNPLGSALLAAETGLAIQETPGSEPQVTACLKNIATSADRCGRIVRTLLRYSRDEPSERQCCSLNDVANEAVDLTRPYAETRGVTVRLEQDPNVPLALMNPLEIEMALVNLMRNAVRASTENMEVLLRTERLGDLVGVAVSDHGCGMTTEQITHMFDPLYTTHQNAGGSGLGLAIAAAIIQKHQGRMEVLSAPGAGTKILVSLPVATPPEPNGTPSRADNHGSDSPCRGRTTTS